MITVIKNGIVITMDQKRKNKYEQLDIVIENDKIKEITKEYKGKYDKIINENNKIVMPGLINAHTHLGMSIFRATNDNLTLQDWLENKIWPIENKMTDKDIYYATLLSCLEMIKTGTTCANDMYFGWKGTMKAITETNMRISMSRCLMGDLDKEGLERIKDFKDLINEYKNNELVTFTVTPHAMYTCTNKYQTSPTKELQKLNYLNHKLILAHGTFIAEDDQKLLTNKDISIVTNPVSNLNLGCGIADLTSYKKQGINICLGTDGQGSGNNLNLFKHMSLVADLQKAMYKDPTIMDSYEVLKMATINGAKALNLAPELITQIVHNIETNNIETTIINGKIIYENKKLNLNINEQELKDNITKIYTRLKV